MEVSSRRKEFLHEEALALKRKICDDFAELRAVFINLFLVPLTRLTKNLSLTVGYGKKCNYAKSGSSSSHVSN